MFDLEQIDVILVVLVMAGSLPELQVEHVRGDDLLISSHSVLSSNQLD
jgi:hypothetical protein